MKKKLATWRLLCRSLEAHSPAMLLYVLDSKRSSPGRTGFFMAVTRTEMRGSIGGGIMEHKFVELAKQRLEFNGPEPNVITQFHDKAAAKNQSGMICSGEQTILLYLLKQEDLLHLKNIIACLENNRSGIIHFSPGGLVYNEGLVHPSGYVVKKDGPLPGNHLFSFKNENDWQYTENTGYLYHLYIIGGGHCALALSTLMTSMDFYITIFDDRKDLNTMLQNDSANELINIATYEDVHKLIPEGDNIFVVIMTNGYRSDDLVLRSLMKKKFRYIGVLGSKAKIEKMFYDYRMEGINEEMLNRINAPIGLSINSQTPEEIAVSIAAQIIRHKNT